MVVSGLGTKFPHFNQLCISIAVSHFPSAFFTRNVHFLTLKPVSSFLDPNRFYFRFLFLVTIPRIPYLNDVILC
eukprot:c28807_g1_i1 orf=89-310(+)